MPFYAPEWRLALVPGKQAWMQVHFRDDFRHSEFHLILQVSAGTMSSARTDGSIRPAGATSWLRWAMVGLLSLLLHLLALNWANGNLPMQQSLDEEPPAALQTTLIQVQAPQASPRPKPVPAVPPAAKSAKPRPKPPAPVAANTALAVATETTPVLSAAASDTAMASIPASSTPPAGAAADAGFGWPEIAALETAAATPEQNSYRIDPPPSATLGYDVQALREERMVYGHGKIAWKANGSQYTIDGEAGILFISLLNFGSRGQIDEFGIAPTQYTEKRFRRPPTETRFDRAGKLISFSASAKSFPLQGGEQDRASIIWQLAGIGRGDATRFVPGAQISLFIAGVRDGSTWNIQVLGEEDIQVGLGALRAWHVRRAPRAGDKDQIIDIWLAPSHHWYPVKLRFTETNGEYLDMSLADIKAPQS